MWWSAPIVDSISGQRQCVPKPVGGSARRSLRFPGERPGEPRGKPLGIFTGKILALNREYAGRAGLGIKRVITSSSRTRDEGG